MIISMIIWLEVVRQLLAVRPSWFAVYIVAESLYFETMIVIFLIGIRPFMNTFFYSRHRHARLSWELWCRLIQFLWCSHTCGLRKKAFLRQTDLTHNGSWYLVLHCAVVSLLWLPLYRQITYSFSPEVRPLRGRLFLVHRRRPPLLLPFSFEIYQHLLGLFVVWTTLGRPDYSF